MKNFRNIRIIIIVFFGVISYRSLAQQEIKKTLSSDTLNVGYYSKFDSDYEIPDTFYYIVDPQKYNSHWKVYDALNPGNLLLDFSCKNDSCTLMQFYSSGHLKRKITETSENGFIFYEELWCDNGQLIRKVDYRKTPQKINNYYCNGKKKNEFTLDSYKQVGEHTMWYSNGQLWVNGYFDNDGEKMGTWEYYDKQGNLEKKEIYEKGKLVSTIKP